MQLYLIRHGQSFNNTLPEDSTDRVHDPELTEIGAKQAELVAKYLVDTVMAEGGSRLLQDESTFRSPFNIAHLYCSPMKRAIQTAQPIAKVLGVQPEVHPNIYEFGGIFLEKDGIATGYGGMTKGEMLAFQPDLIVPDSVTDTGWYDVKLAKEAIPQSMGRGIAFAHEMIARGSMEEARDEKIIVVSHGGFIAFTLKALMDNIPSFGYMYRHFNTAITRVNFAPNRPIEFMYINRFTHLPPELMT